jgi:hypothetical protein
VHGPPDPAADPPQARRIKFVRHDRPARWLVQALFSLYLGLRVPLYSLFIFWAVVDILVGQAVVWPIVRRWCGRAGHPFCIAACVFRDTIGRVRLRLEPEMKAQGPEIKNGLPAG